MIDVVELLVMYLLNLIAMSILIPAGVALYVLSQHKKEEH